MFQVGKNRLIDVEAMLWGPAARAYPSSAFDVDLHLAEEAFGVRLTGEGLASLVTQWIAVAGAYRPRLFSMNPISGPSLGKHAGSVLGADREKSGRQRRTMAHPGDFAFVL